jgi:hypothetical protein
MGGYFFPVKSKIYVEHKRMNLGTGCKTIGLGQVLKPQLTFWDYC